MQLPISFHVVVMKNIGILANLSVTIKNKVMIWEALSKISFLGETNGNLFIYTLSSFSSGYFSYKCPEEPVSFLHEGKGFLTLYSQKW